MSITKFLSQIPVIKSFFDYTPVPVIRLSGVLSEGQSRRQTISHERFRKLIEKAFEIADAGEDKKSCVALIINSPGGSPAQSELIGNQIRQLADEKSIPVYAFVEDVAASGGYWLACAADEIYTTRSSIVGSIGVIAATFGFQDIIQKHGIERRVYSSGKEKSFLDPFLPAKQKDIDRVKSLQEVIHGHFKDWVRERRGDKLKDKDGSLFEGQFWSGEEAIKNGIVDGINDCYSFIDEKYGDKAMCIDLQPDKKWFSLPGMFGSQTKISAYIANDVFDHVNERALWQHYGL